MSAVDDAKNTGKTNGDGVIKDQGELLGWNRETNTAMAWLQAANDLAKKIKG